MILKTTDVSKTMKAVRIEPFCFLQLLSYVIQCKNSQKNQNSQYIFKIKELSWLTSDLMTSSKKC